MFAFPPNALKKSITANGNWGNGYTWHVLSDYHDELKPFLHVIRKHGTANERVGPQRQWAACHVLCESTIRLNDQALAGEGGKKSSAILLRLRERCTDSH